ncbi:hypothetical protein D3C76_1665320 [compost metagenome]
MQRVLPGRYKLACLLCLSLRRVDGDIRVFAQRQHTLLAFMEEFQPPELRAALTVQQIQPRNAAFFLLAERFALGVFEFADCCLAEACHGDIVP